MKKLIAVLLALLCLAMIPAAASALQLKITIQSVYDADEDATYTRDEVITLMEDAYALGAWAAEQSEAKNVRLPTLLVAAVVGVEGSSSSGIDYVLNSNSHKFHYPWCDSVPKISPDHRIDFCGTREEVISQGYKPCGNCNP